MGFARPTVLIACILANLSAIIFAQSPAATEGNPLKPTSTISSDSEPASDIKSRIIDLRSPRVLRFNGLLTDQKNDGVVQLRFTLYGEEVGGSPLWSETHQVNVQDGKYSVLLGTTSKFGMPMEVFSGNQARWLAVERTGTGEIGRSLLVSVPYALKAVEAERLSDDAIYSLASNQELLDAVITSVEKSLNREGHPVDTKAIIPKNNLRQATNLPLVLGSVTHEPRVPPNSGSGTTLNRLARLDSVGFSDLPVGAIGGAIGVIVGGAGGSGTPEVAYGGLVHCDFDGAATQGDYVQISATVGGSCHDAGPSYPASGQVVGRVLQTISSAGPALMSLYFGEVRALSGGGSGTVTSITAGNGLSGGTITTTGTIEISNGGVSNAMLANSALTITAGTGLSGGGLVALGGSVSLVNAGALSFNGRSGVVLPLAGDYSFAQIGGAASFGQLPVGTVSNTIAAGDDVRFSDARIPLAGSSNYIQNTTTPQTANLNITGTANVSGLIGTATVSGAVGVRGVGGAGTGVGVSGQGTDSGSGVVGVGGLLSGSSGVLGNGSGPNGIGVIGVGAGTGPGLLGSGGSGGGHGVIAQGASGGNGVTATGGASSNSGNGIGVLGTGGSGDGTGVRGVGGPANGIGVRGLGTGTGAGGQFRNSGNNANPALIVRNSGDSSTVFSVNGNGAVTASSSVTAASFSGDGSALTGLSATNLGSGTIPAGRLSGSYTIDISGNATTANSFFANGANCPAGQYSAGIDGSGNAEGCSSNGSALTNLNAANVVSGVLGVSNGGTGSSSQNFVDLATGQTIAGAKTLSDLLTVSAGISIGSGTSILKHLSASAPLDFVAWAGGDCQELTITVAGAADGDSVVLGVPSTLASTPGVIWSAYVSAPNTVTVRGCKATAGGSIDPAVANVRADVWQH